MPTLTTLDVDDIDVRVQGELLLPCRETSLQGDTEVTVFLFLVWLELSCAHCLGQKRDNIPKQMDIEFIMYIQNLQ